MAKRTTRNPVLEQLAHEAQHVLKTTHIDLSVFLACDGVERARRWREDYSTADRENLVAQQLERVAGDWTPEDVAKWVAHYNEKYGATDRVVPAAAEILAVAKERMEADRRAGNHAGAAQLARLRVNIDRGARLTWQLGDLLIQSVNTPGAVYVVNRRGCTCPNGQAGKSQCWHVCLFDLLLDMQQDAADAADVAAARHQLITRLAAARRRQLEAA